MGTKWKTSISKFCYPSRHKEDRVSREHRDTLNQGSLINKINLPGAGVLHIVPTILHSLGRPISTSADGDVLDIFEIGSPPAENGIERIQHMRETTSTTETDRDFKNIKNIWRASNILNNSAIQLV